MAGDWLEKRTSRCCIRRILRTEDIICNIFMFTERVSWGIPLSIFSRCSGHSFIFRSAWGCRRKSELQFPNLPFSSLHANSTQSFTVIFSWLGSTFCCWGLPTGSLPPLFSRYPEPHHPNSSYRPKVPRFLSWTARPGRGSKSWTVFASGKWV